MEYGYETNFGTAQYGKPAEDLTTRLLTAAESGWESSELASLTRWGKKQYEDYITPEEEYISPEKADFDYGVTVDQPISIGAAEIMAERRREEEHRQKIINNGNQDLMTRGFIFGSTMLGAMSDPVGLAIGTVTGMGATSLISKMALNAAKAGKVSMLAGKTKLAADILGNIGGNLASEFGIVHPIAREFDEEPDLALSVASSLGLGIGLPLLSHGLKGLWKAGRGMGAEDIERGMNQTAMDLEVGNTPRMDSEQLDIAQAGDKAFEGKDPIKVRQEANAPQRKAGYNEEARMNALDDSPPQPVEQQFTNKIEELKASELPDDIKTDLEQNATTYVNDRVKSYETLSKAAIGCLKG